jgi:hypothetical protein
MTDQSQNPQEAIRLKALEDRLMIRISRLERAHRRRGWMNALLLVGLAGSVAVGGAIIFDPALARGLTDVGSEVHAHRFVLEDQDGNLRGLWQLDEEGTVRLSIHDAAGNPRMNLAVLEDGAPGISFADGDDRRRVVLGLLPDQTSTLVFADGSGIPRAVLGVSGQGSANLLFADREGVSRVSVGLDASGAGNLTLPEATDEANPDEIAGSLGGEP